MPKNLRRGYKSPYQNWATEGSQVSPLRKVVNFIMQCAFSTLIWFLPYYIMQQILDII